MVVICLCQDDVFQVIGFNTHDVPACRTGASPLGLSLWRLAGFQGRRETIVKLRGSNVYQTGIGAILTEAHPKLQVE